VKLIDGVFQFYKLDNINESPSDKIVKFDGILNIHEGEYLTDILSDIRSLQGITIVRNEDIVNEDLKTKLRIKVDPYPFGDQGEQKIISYLIKKIKQIPGVRDFQKIKHTEQEKTTEEETEEVKTEPVVEEEKKEQEETLTEKTVNLAEENRMLKEKLAVVELSEKVENEFCLSEDKKIGFVKSKEIVSKVASFMAKLSQSQREEFSAILSEVKTVDLAVRGITSNPKAKSLEFNEDNVVALSQELLDSGKAKNIEEAQKLATAQLKK